MCDAIGSVSANDAMLCNVSVGAGDYIDVNVVGAYADVFGECTSSTSTRTRVCAHHGLPLRCAAFTFPTLACLVRRCCGVEHCSEQRGGLVPRRARQGGQQQPELPGQR